MSVNSIVFVIKSKGTKMHKIKDITGGVYEEY